ncbi:hypothetical protein OHA35_28775 [Streptomyces sp. NBC_00233]|nr:hypothetical protein [Streptomyces sp. NBC_00233]
MLERTPREASPIALEVMADGGQGGNLVVADADVGGALTVELVWTARPVRLVEAAMVWSMAS